MAKGEKRIEMQEAKEVVPRGKKGTDANTQGSYLE
jgi:hypothetical protein